MKLYRDNVINHQNQLIGDFMNNNIRLLPFFLCFFLFVGAFSLDAKAAPQAATKKEVLALSKRLDAIDNQQKNAMSDLKRGVDETRAELVSLRKELEAVKNQKSTATTELVAKFQAHQKEITDAKKLEQILVKYGNNPDGMSTLHYAIKMGDVNAVNLLLANGADVNSKDGSFTTLTRAAICNQFEITQLLLSMGADVNLTASENLFYALNYAAEFGSAELVTLLVENGAKLDITWPKDGSYAKTPLHTAAKAGNYETVVALINAGAHVDGNIPRNIGGHQTPLDVAAEYLEYSVNPQNLELVKLLVEHGATRRYLNYLENPRTNNVKCPVISGYLQGVRR